MIIISIFQEFSRSQPLFFPMVPFFLPIVILFRYQLAKETLKNSNSKDKSTTYLAGEDERDQLITTLCDRLVFGKLANKFNFDDNAGGDGQKMSFHTILKKKKKSARMLIASKLKRQDTENM